MIDIAALVALRDGVAATSGEGLQRAAGLDHEQDLAALSVQAGSSYPAKTLALENGRYHVVDHKK